MDVQDNFAFMKDLAIQGLQHKGVYDDEWYQNQLEEELKVIEKTKLEDFFLQTAYICALIDDAGIFRGPARGSCLASVICYGLNITKIPPKEHDLSFARFLNETRAMTSLPDIDTDVSSDMRDEVISLIIDEFGQEYCAQVSTRIPYSPKMALKALTRMSGGNFDEINKITLQLADDEDYKDNEAVQAFLQRNPFVRDNLEDMIGLLKAYGKHPGAVIIFDKPLWNYTSVIKLKGNTIIANTGVECESQGFLKNDTLSVKVLDIQRDCLKIIDDPNVKLPYDFDDPKVFETICKDPLGIFQLEKGAGRQAVSLIQPSNFNEMVATISLIRPGARNNGMDQQYADYKFGRKKPVYLDERLKTILGKTQGLMIFQEDIMAVARELAGMSDLETDHLRRAISKKKKQEFDKSKKDFLSGCKKNNVDEKVANELWSNMEKSSDYSFNRSHAVGYAALGYQSAWLKTYYPLEFAVAMLIHVDESEKRVEILQMIKDSEAQLCNPNVNKSKLHTYIDDNNIYMGFDLVDSMSVKSSEAIIEERTANGDFTSFDDFCARVPPRKCNKRIKENLVWAGAFDDIPVTDEE